MRQTWMSVCEGKREENFIFSFSPEHLSNHYNNKNMNENEKRK